MLNVSSLTISRSESSTKNWSRKVYQTYFLSQNNVIDALAWTTSRSVEAYINHTIFIIILLQPR